MMSRMNRKGAWRIGVMAIVGCLGLALLAQRVVNAESAGKSKEAKVDAALVERRLKEILETQQHILQQLEAMAQELQVIKVRCTR